VDLEDQLLDRLKNAPDDILSDIPLIEGSIFHPIGSLSFLKFQWVVVVHLSLSLALSLSHSLSLTLSHSLSLSLTLSLSLIFEGLEATKLASIEINAAVAKGMETEIAINIAREVYRRVAAEGWFC
jgi:hypothetical protein